MLRQPLPVIRQLIDIVKAQELLERVHSVQLAIISRAAFSGDGSRVQAELVDTILPELKEVNTLQDPLTEQRTVELLERAGRSIVRKRPTEGEG